MKHIDISTISLIEIPKIIDKEGRGNLSVVEKDLLPYEIKRVFYLYDVPSDGSRGGHAHKELLQFLVPLSGSFDVVLDNGKDRRVFNLNRPYKGLLIPNGVWSSLENFSAGSVCLSLVSAEYDEADYIRDYDDYLTYTK